MFQRIFLNTGHSLVVKPNMILSYFVKENQATLKTIPQILRALVNLYRFIYLREILKLEHLVTYLTYPTPLALLGK